MHDPVQQDVFQAKYIPSQSSPPSGAPGDMKVNISSYPPMGQVTVLDKSVTTFIVLLETDENRGNDEWEVSVWHSSANDLDWVERPMKSSSDPVILPIKLTRSISEPGTCSMYFRTDLRIDHVTKFTLKFRPGAHNSWKWMNSQMRTYDGILIPKPSTERYRLEHLSDVIGDLNPVFESSQVRSDTPGVTVWDVQTLVSAADSEHSWIGDIKFGKPWSGNFLRWFALIRIWTPWLAPSHGKQDFALDKGGILLSFLESKGQHLVLLAVSGIDDVTVLFKSDGEGNIVLEGRNDSDQSQKARIIAAVGNDFEMTNAAAVYHARMVLRDSKVSSGEEQLDIKASKQGVEPEWMENWFDGLTYCTWNGLGQQLTEEKVILAVDTLAENNINITNLIIDDNWQSLDYRGHGQFQHGWVEFEADRKAFPNGLRHLVSKIRDKHHGIEHIAVWHALLGYWGGLAPDGKIAQTYKTKEVVRVDGERRNLPLGGKMTVIAPEDVGKYYIDFYAFLSSCGVDAVKTDAQFMLDTLSSARARRDLSTAYLDAWAIATLRTFGTKAISCMSQTPLILFHSQLPNHTPPILVRNSDDFFPEIPSSHPWHIFANASNSLFTQHLNLLPDWDMFQTVHDYSGFHAAARCVSGGPIYITDVPGKHDLGLIEQMTGQTTRGKTVIFRPNVGKTLDAYIGYNDEVILKIGTYHGNAMTGTGIIGLFNISSRPLTELLPLSRFPGVVDAQLYVVRSHLTGTVSDPIQLVDPSALIMVALRTRGYDILSAFPLRGFVRDEYEETLWVANLGLLGKMVGAAAILGTNIGMEKTGKVTLSTRLKALGILGIYVSTLPDAANWEDKLLITIQDQVVPKHTVCVRVNDPKILRIDTAAAWKELRLDPGWGNELTVKIYINK